MVSISLQEAAKGLQEAEESCNKKNPKTLRDQRIHTVGWSKNPAITS